MTAYLSLAVAVLAVVVSSLSIRRSVRANRRMDVQEGLTGSSSTRRPSRHAGRAGSSTSHGRSPR
jgi:hypothetical protein